MANETESKRRSRLGAVGGGFHGSVINIPEYYIRET